MSRVVRLRGATWARVEALMTTHGKSADAVLAMGLDALAALDGEPPARPTPQPRGRWAGRAVTAQRDLRLPLLEILWRLGGEAETAAVRAALEAWLGEMGPDDVRVLASGQPRWWNAACWEKLAMVKAGLLEAGRRGVWVMTAAGRAAYLER